MWSNKQSMMSTRPFKPGIVKPVVFLLALTLLTACGSITQSDKPVISTWWLKPYESPSPRAPAGQLPRLSIILTVIPGLDTDKILTLSADSELKHYTGARWTDNLPELLGSITRRSLQASGRFNVVAANTSAGLDACSLMLEVQKFYVINQVVNVAMEGQYSCNKGEITAINTTSTASFDENRTAVIVASFQQATNEVMQDILKSLP